MRLWSNQSLHGLLGDVNLHSNFGKLERTIKTEHKFIFVFTKSYILES